MLWHVGFAVSGIDAEEGRATMRVLRQLAGQSSDEFQAALP